MPRKRVGMGGCRLWREASVLAMGGRQVSRCLAGADGVGGMTNCLVLVRGAWSVAQFLELWLQSWRPSKILPEEVDSRTWGHHSRFSSQQRGLCSEYLSTFVCRDSLSTNLFMMRTIKSFKFGETSPLGLGHGRRQQSPELGPEETKKSWRAISAQYWTPSGDRDPLHLRKSIRDACVESTKYPRFTMI